MYLKDYKQQLSICLYSIPTLQGWHGLHTALPGDVYAGYDRHSRGVSGSSQPWLVVDSYGGKHMGATQKESEGPSNEGSSKALNSEEGVSNESSIQDTTEEEPLSLDLIFEVLKNERRREVIRYLRDHESQVSLSDLAEHIAALENDTDVASITSSQRKRVYVGLYQCHLPKMADMGIIDFNQNRGIIRLGEKAEQLYVYLDNDSVQGREWHWYYIAIAVTAAVATTLSLLLASTTVVPLVVTTVGTILAVGGCSVLQMRIATE
jgi:DNA-binding transcriptional ArsR family regulator